MAVLAFTLVLPLPVHASCAAPELTLSEREIGSGGEVQVHGVGFGPCNDTTGGCGAGTQGDESPTVTLRLQRQPIDGEPPPGGTWQLGTYTAENGSFDADVTLPDVPGGPYSVVAIVLDRNRADAPLLIRD